MTERKKPKKASRPKKAGQAKNAATQRLSMQQERFVHEYLSDPELNATAAYARAGYRASGQAARTAASRLLRQPAVKAAIAAIRAKDAAKFEITRERVMQQYAYLAFSDPRQFFNEDGTFKNVTEMDYGTAVSLTRFKIREEFDGVPAKEELEGQPHGGALKRRQATDAATGQVVEIAWHDQKSALDSIVRLQGWLKEGKPDGSEGNPLHMIVQDMQGRGSALTPASTCDDGDDE
ncbi:terminase small subunit [Sphingobium sufflavum]|uniref:terminase small subunit n=1 Tax=Sphingobium sufflavum TaxID=1129547 RepID=UPI001F198FBF|nr:terminase small subunit [Sphingobium sufflavum]MCE7797867.1 terminase small subunit [Sphingobium sufflavum]